MSAKKSFNGAVCFEAALTGLTLLFLMVPVIQMVSHAFTVNAFRGINPDSPHSGSSKFSNCTAIRLSEVLGLL